MGLSSREAVYFLRARKLRRSALPLIEPLLHNLLGLPILIEVLLQQMPQTTLTIPLISLLLLSFLSSR